MRTSLLNLSTDIVVLLPDYLHNVEDYLNLSATCRTLQQCTEKVSPRTLLRLAAAKDRELFRPAPYLLIAATARELGNWARKSDTNEHKFAMRLESGIDALMELALECCGITMERIKELYELHFSIINPIYDIIDKCVGQQWYALDNFWYEVSDAYTIGSEPTETFWHLVIYGELFAPDLEAFLDGNTTARRLKVETRLEFVKYCIPDFATTCYEPSDITLPSGILDPRRTVKETGPYTKDDPGLISVIKDHNVALTWVIRSSRFRPYWKAMRLLAGPDFQEDFKDGWWYDADSEEADSERRQRMWENVMLCQGLEGMGMMRPELRGPWVPKVKEWREKIATLKREPETVKIGKQATLECPYLMGDLRCCASGFVGGS